MKINITWTTEEKAKMAGKTCSKKAVLDLIETKLAIVINSNKYNEEEFLSGAKSVLGTAPIIGYQSNEGIIVPDGFLNPKNVSFAGMLAIGDNDTKVGTAISNQIGEERNIGKSVAKQAMKKVGTKASPSYYIMFVLSGNSEEYAKGIKDIIGDVPCFGGKIEKGGKIFNEDITFTNGLVVAFIYTNKKIENIFKSKFHETINSGVITKITDDNKLDEIDGIKALKKYCEWTNKKIRDVKEEKIFNESILMPLAVKTSDGSLAIIKHPTYGNNNYSIYFEHKIAINTAIVQMQISKEELVNSPSLILRELKKKTKQEIKGFLLISDIETKNILQEEQIENLAKKIKKEAGDIPFLVIFTKSQFGKGEYSSNHFGKLMLSEIAICN